MPNRQETVQGRGQRYEGTGLRYFNCNKARQFAQNCRHRRREVGRDNNRERSDQWKGTIGDNSKSLQGNGRKAFITRRKVLNGVLSPDQESRSNESARAQNNMAIDSGASENVISDTAYWTDVEEISTIQVELANRSKVIATKRGIARVNARGKVPLLCEAFEIMTIKLNLFACSRFEDYGITTTIQSGKCKLMDRHDQSKISGILPKRKSDGLFAAQIMVPKRHASQSNYKNSSAHVCTTKSSVKYTKKVEELGHWRMGKANIPVVRAMIAAERYGMSAQRKVQSQQCDTCIKSKTKMDACNGTLMDDSKGITIHMNICGPMRN